MIFIKILTFGVVVLLIYLLYDLWRIGRGLAAHRTAKNLSLHKKRVWYVALTSVTAVLLIEFQVRLSPTPYDSGLLLLVIHFAAVALLVLVFAAIVLRFTGVRTPQLHRVLVYAFFGFYAIVSGTGAYLLYNLA
jgi:hypothetical protein